MNTVIIRSADKNEIERAVRAYAAQLRKEHPEIRKILWFGSWVSGRPLPHSDVDICIVISSSKKKIRDRIPDYLPERFPVGVDLFPYTEEELARLETESPEWRNTIIAGIEL